jgi:hypothetical protein
VIRSRPPLTVPIDAAWPTAAPVDAPTPATAAQAVVAPLVAAARGRVARGETKPTAAYSDLAGRIARILDLLGVARVDGPDWTVTRRADATVEVAPGEYAVAGRGTAVVRLRRAREQVAMEWTEERERKAR